MTVDLARLHALAGAVREKQRKPNATGRKPWKITNLSPDTTEVYIYDLIGEDMWGDGVSALDFVTELNAVHTANLDIRINSEGGQVFDGVTMYEAIKRHPAATTGYVDGLAASAASFIIMACDVVKMAGTGRLMIHDAGIGYWSAGGTAADLRNARDDLDEFINLLDSLSDTIAGIYAEKAGGTVAEWRGVMSAGDKWYTASEAVAAKLADGIVGQDDEPDGESSTTETTDRWNPRQFADLMKGVFDAD